MFTPSPSNLSTLAVPFHPSLLIEDESFAGVTAAKGYFGKGYASQCHGDYVGALHHYRSAISLCPDMFEAYFNMGLCFEKSRLTNRAIQAFEHVHRLQPGFRPVCCHLSYLYALLGDKEKSVFYETAYRRLLS